MGAADVRVRGAGPGVVATGDERWGIGGRKTGTAEARGVRAARTRCVLPFFFLLWWCLDYGS